MHLEALDESTWFYKKVALRFKTGWLHTNTKGKLMGVYVIKGSKDRRLKEIRFHGTQRACPIGGRSQKPCDNPECYVCCILKNGFSINHSKAGNMFGPGIYTSEASSKANIYAQNHRIRSHLHVLILCCLDLGNSVTMYTAGHPGSGYDTVEGATKANNGALEYPETVVYNTNNIKPVGIVVYTREDGSLVGETCGLFSDDRIGGLGMLNQN